MKSNLTKNQTKKKSSFFPSIWKFMFVILFFAATSSYGQLLNENFEGGFPAGWTATDNTGYPWMLTNNASGYGVGNNSMRFDLIDVYYGYGPSGAEQMNTILFAPAPSGYYVMFDEAYASFYGAVDSLQINYSTDGGLTFNLLVIWAGGDTGPLNTVGGEIDNVYFYPTSSQWQTLSYPLPVGTNMIQFNGISEGGNTLFLDNINVLQTCSGTPNAGSVTSATNAICPNTNFALMISGADNLPGLTYQWQSSTDGINYFDIAGANGRTYTATELVNTWFQCVVTCTNSLTSAISTPFMMTADVTTLPLVEDFEGAAITSTCWSTTNNTGRPWTLALIASSYNVGLHSAYLDFFDMYNGGSEQLTSPSFAPSTSGYVLEFDEAYASADNSLEQLQISYSTDGGSTFTQLVMLDGGDAGILNTGGDEYFYQWLPQVSQWKTFSYTLPVGTTNVQFNGITYGNGDPTFANNGNGNNLYLDNIQIKIPAACTGTPNAGTTFSSGNPAGVGTNFILSLQNWQNVDGLTYQWQSSPDNINYTNITGATNNTCPTSGTSSTYYQCVVTCPNSGLSSTSVPVYEIMTLNYSWTPIAALAPHNNLGNTLQLSDGTVLCKSEGGASIPFQTVGTIWDKLTPDIHGSYINGTWTSTSPMISERWAYSSQVLKDGRVYTSGGEYGTDGTQAGKHAETYNPLTDTWTAAACLGITISDANSEILENGMVLQDYPYYNIYTLYDPTTNTTSQAYNTLANSNEAMWVKLPDNSILYVNTAAITSERYIPSLNQWITDANTPVNLYDPYGAETGPGLLLPNGTVWFTGSTGHTAYYTPSGNTSPGTWTIGPDMPNGYGMPDAPAALMPNGKILFTCTYGANSNLEFPVPTYFYEFDYLTNIFTLINAPNGKGYYNSSSQQWTLMDLPDGTVLACVNQDTLSAQYYIYTPSGSQVNANKPVIAAITPSACDTFLITGTGFNGNSEGSAFGDDNQNATNYPIVRLTSGSNVYYARSYNWNSTGVMRGNTPDTAYFTTPAGIPAGMYDLVVTANGIKSDSVSIYIGLPAQPNAITGNAAPCYNSTQTYSVSPVVGANSYVWTIPGNWTGSSTTNSITVTLMNGSGNITVSAVNGCGNSPAQTLAVTTVHLPSQPGIISGPLSACAGSTQTYYIAPVTGATSYIWTLPTGWSGTSASDSITVTVGNAGGNVMVRAVNSCGSGSSRALFVSALKVPLTPGQISGPANACQGTTETYTIASVTNATGYFWSVPSGWSGTSTTTSITVTVGSGSGNILVLASNNCGYSISARTLAVNAVAVPAQPGTITGNSTVCQGTAQNYHITAVSGATSYTWTLPGGWTGSSTSVSISTTVGASGGNITVKANNNCGSSSVTNLDVTVNAIPAEPGTINGNSSVCQGTIQTYTVAPITGATSYVWTKPTGWVGISTTNSITLTVNATSGFLTVKTVNSCGSSSVQSLPVTAHANTAVIISGNPGNYNFCAQTNPTSEMLMASSGYNSYSWSPSGGNSQTATVSSVNIYTVTGTNFAGCTSTASKSVTSNCALPNNLSTSNILGTSAKANWMTSQCAVNYAIRISVHGLNTWTNYTATVNSKSFTGLSLSTSYDWQIMTNCNTSGTVNSGWSATQTFTTLAQRITEEEATTAFSIYPNPADAIVTIAFSTLEEGSYTIKLIDMMGRDIKSEIISAGLGDNIYLMNLDDIAKGAYLIMLQHGDNISKGKLIVQ